MNIEDNKLIQQIGDILEKNKDAEKVIIPTKVYQHSAAKYTRVLT